MFTSFWFLALVAWPTVLMLCALLNMMIWWKFHWAEPFIQAPLAGIAIGSISWWMFQSDPGGAAEVVRAILVIMSHGVLGVLRVADVVRDPVTFFWWSAIGTLGATALAAALDHAASKIGPTGGGAWALSILLFLLKAPFCLVSTSIGLLIFAVGAIQAAISSGNQAGFAGGAPWAEWNRSASGYWATTVGATFHCWRGRVEDVFEHELHHTRQCIYFRDWMIPMWVLGEIGHLATGVNHGNPLEAVPYQIQ